ncbi:SIS domain-containing protein [Bacillus sp. FJAT-47783]|uniref:SIS domain-containing protein n=1 Tax=Bacillus sp. FJAT-47783 TaxID=2922712 RepID=UPI00325FCB04
MALFQQYFREIQKLLSEIERDEATNIRHAAKQIAAALENDAIIHYLDVDTLIF